MQYGERKDIKYDSNTWRTPESLFSKLNDLYHFNFDGACTSEDALCYYGNFIDKGIDGLTSDWKIPCGNDDICGVTRAFVNPPYGKGNLDPWTHKIAEVSTYPHVEVVVALLPAYTDTKWFQDNVFRKANLIFFLKGRVKYLPPKNMTVKPSTPTFGSCIAVYNIEDYWIDLENIGGYTVYNGEI